MSPLKLSDAQELAKDLQNSYSERDTMYDQVEAIFDLDVSGLPTGAWVKTTIDPSPRNALRGAVQLMTPTVADWSMSKDVQNPDQVDSASKIERMAYALVRSSDRATGKRLNVQAATSALMFSQIDIAIIETAKLAALLQGKAKQRMERIADTTPVLFEVMHPKMCYPLYDVAGLSAHTSKRKLTVRDIKGRYGEGADTAGKDKPTELIDVWEYWDIENHYVWVDGASTALNKEVLNPYEYIPIVSHVVEGGDMYSTNDSTSRQPMLYAVNKAGLWAASNINLTLQTSLAFAVGANPMFLYRANQQDKPAPNVDYTRPGGVVTIGPNEDYAPMGKNAIDPSLSQTAQIYAQLIEQSTMYKQALGQPLGGNSSFSETSLLAQAGRLPLAPYKAGVEHALASTMTVAFEMLRKAGKSKAFSDKGLVDFEPKDLPEAFDIQCSIKLDQPSDERQNAAIAIQVVQAGLASREWAMENILKIGKPDEMTYQIYREQFEQAIAQQMIQQGQMPTPEQMAQAQGGQVAPGQDAMMQGDPMAMQQGNPAEAMAAMQQAGPGMPMSQPQDPRGMPPMPGMMPGEGGMM